MLNNLSCVPVFKNSYTFFSVMSVQIFRSFFSGYLFYIIEL